MFETKTADDVLLELNAANHGLAEEEAKKRLATQGPNALKAKKPPTKLQMFLSQLKDPMIYVLLAAAVVSIALREFSDAGIILGVVLLNAIVGMVQEGKAQRALDALREMSSPTATVRRGGVVRGRRHGHAPGPGHDGRDRALSHRRAARGDPAAAVFPV